MILFGFISLILFVLTIFVIDNIETNVLKKNANLSLRLASKNYKLNSELADNNLFEVDSKVKLYWFDEELFQLKSKGEVLDKRSLKFLNFPSFENYINKPELNMKIFKNGEFKYLFAPLKLDSETKIVVFVRKTISIERIMKKQKTPAHNNV